MNPVNLTKPPLETEALAVESIDDLFERYGPAYRWLATITCMLGAMTMVLSQTTVDVAFPDIMGAFGIGRDEAQWLSSGFFAAMTAGMLLQAWLVLIFGERSGDLGPLIDALMGHINEKNKKEPDFVPKTLSLAARSFLMQRSWPGNVRELKNTLMRASVWSDNEQITEAEILDSVFALPAEGRTENDILGRPIEESIEIQGLLDEVARHYIGRAIEHAEGNKTVAATLLGLPSYQTLTNWMKRYDVG